MWSCGMHKQQTRTQRLDSHLLYRPIAEDMAASRQCREWVCLTWQICHRASILIAALCVIALASF